MRKNNEKAYRHNLRAVRSYSIGFPDNGNKSAYGSRIIYGSCHIFDGKAGNNAWIYRQYSWNSRYLRRFRSNGILRLNIKPQLLPKECLYMGTYNVGSMPAFPFMQHNSTQI